MKLSLLPADLKVGDLVMLADNRSGAGYFEISRIMPVTVDGEQQYRVRGSDGGERAVRLHQIYRTSPAL